MKLFPQDILSAFEFDKVLAEVEKRCESIMGTDRVQKVRPMDKYEEIVKILQQTKEMVQVLTLEDKFPAEKIYDTRETVKLLIIENYVLHEEQLNQLRSAARLSGNFIKFFANKKEIYPVLNQFTQNILFEKNIITSINKILDDDGKLRNDASPELVRIRKERDTQTRGLDKSFQSVLQKLRKQGVLSEVEESMRNGRRVFGIQSEFKRQIKGIIHDESDTGKTIFIEPEEIVTIQNNIFELEREEKREIYIILKNTTAEIAPYQKHFESYQWLLSIIDFTRAKAKYALDINANLPVIEKTPQLYLYNAKHPVLFQINKRSKKEVIPLQVELDSDNRILVISGPNAGGKSVSMKTIALLQIMLQSGLLIPAADHSRVGIFKNIFCDVGDTQSLEDELSTYSSRLIKMKYFLQFADKDTLFFIDEFGTGTDPIVGGAIAEAVLDELNKKRAFGVVTTHYSNLKVFASNHAGVLNASMLYDEAELKPTYQLETGKPGSSYAFEIAQKTDLSKNVIESAKNLVSKEHIRFEELLKSVRIEKEHLKLREKELSKKEQDLKHKELNMREAIDKAKEKERQFNLKKLEKEDDVLRKMEFEFKNLLDELKNAQPAEMQIAKEKLRTFLSTNRNRNNKERKTQFIRSSPNQLSAEIKIGEPVTLISGTEIGLVESIQKNIAVVVFKNMKTKVPLEELVGVDVSNFTHQTKQIVNVQMDDEKFNTELDLRGKAKEEAMMELENFLDKALMRNVFQLRIMHGKGTGVLRTAVQ
ncbi:MAG: Smr/MutS family protein, partial [Fimbriimonadaceae bacterium]|nr:Smr/MutS family protein [Chitinophagales bacterium]